MSDALVRPDSPTEPLVTTAQVAEHLNASTATVLNLINAGLPALRLGRTYRYRLSAVDAWLEARGVA